MFSRFGNSAFIAFFCIFLVWFPSIRASLPSSIVTEECTQVFETYDFDNNRTISFDEFQSFFQSLFDLEDRRYIVPKTVNKIFEYLDFGDTHHLDLSEFCKVFKHLVVPLIATRSCMLYCMPHSTFKLNSLKEELSNLDTILLNKSQTMFDIRQVYISDCNLRWSPLWNKKIHRYTSRISQLIPNANSVEIYNLDKYNSSILHKDFDQLVLRLNNVFDHTSAISQFILTNTKNQIPVVIVTNRTIRDLDSENYFPGSILVPENFLTNRQEFIRYKMHLATILARKIYRRYNSSHYFKLL